MIDESTGLTGAAEADLAGEVAGGPPSAPHLPAPGCLGDLGTLLESGASLDPTRRTTSGPAFVEVLEARGYRGSNAVLRFEQPDRLAKPSPLASARTVTLRWRRHGELVRSYGHERLWSLEAEPRTS